MSVSGGLAADKTLFDFETEALPAEMSLHQAAAGRVTSGTGMALRVQFERVDWPNVGFAAPLGTWDWSGYSGLAVEIANPEAEAVEVAVRIDNPGGDGAKDSNTARTTVPAGATKTLECRFLTPEMAGPYWGMRGVPGLGPLPQGSTLDPARIDNFQVFLPMPEKPRTLILDNLRLFGGGAQDLKAAPLPFVDPFGQYKHEDWPGKIFSEQEMKAASLAEEAELAASPGIAGRDSLGGWADGPQLEATGWFRTEKVEGKWWLVTPEGRLFFSNGLDCVGTWNETFVEGREGWFEGLPREDSPFGPCYGFADNVHSMAEEIGGKGKTYGFYRANLLRKDGEEWPQRWLNRSYARLKSWGFNTLGNWCEGSVLEHSPLPFVVPASIAGKHRRVEGGEGYWAKMHDVFDPEFEASVQTSLTWATDRYGSNPLCIGYFVDNEHSWGSDADKGIAAGVLNSPTDQPARVAFIRDLEVQYGDIGNLNLAWGTQAPDWNRLRAPSKGRNEACDRDLDAFVYRFSLRYFETIAKQLEERAPHQLYLGCRFSSWNARTVEAAAKVCDVVSFNLYKESVDRESYAFLEALDRPAIIGEFHFGALDRGMFHTGLVPAANQKERAEKYIRYVESVADHPCFVGCHWFQYADEPITGRTYDGENYNIGFVTVTDTPYPEMVEAARKVHGEVYGRRWGK